jgi:hypothetical protein
MNFWQYKTNDVPEKDVTPFGNVLHGIDLVILPFFDHPMIDTCGLRRLNYSTTAGTIRWALVLCFLLWEWWRLSQINMGCSEAAIAVWC